jgi:hypothetical protein
MEGSVASCWSGISATFVGLLISMLICHSNHNAVRVLLAISIVFFFAADAFGWGATGHRATGWVAEQHLNAKAKKQLADLLGQESLAMAATWMDDVRADSTYDYMTDWHWVTIETGQTYDQSVKNKNGDIIMTLERIVAELKSKKLDRRKEIEAIKILIHLVGDLHQPLHVGCCDDSGGNRVKVKYFRDDTNLHSVWDSQMIDGTKLSYTELAQSLGMPDKATVKEWQSTKVRDWANESMTYRPQVYKVGKGSLSYEYVYYNMPIVEERLVRAGVRLAGILNEIYGK